MSAPLDLPRWADTVLVPAISVVAAFLVAGLVVLAIGENPLTATRWLLQGSLGTGEGLGFTLFYMTDFIFVGLAVAVAYHAGLFNIGGEGQATLAGLGVALVVNNLTFLPGFLLIPLGILGAAAFGAAWAAVPGYLQAKRGSHIVITTIMFNFIAAATLNYVLVNQLRPTGSMDPASARFPEATNLPALTDSAAAAPLGDSGANAAAGSSAAFAMSRNGLATSPSQIRSWSTSAKPRMASAPRPRPAAAAASSSSAVSS